MRLILFLLVACCACRAPHGAEPAPDLRVMSFNIRYGTASDGLNHWSLRHGLVMEVVEEFSPTVLCVQEALRFQLDELATKFPGLAEIGVGRSDGVSAGEYSAILYDRERLSLLDQGTFWLSDTPEVIASTSWGNGITRICTWAEFEEQVGGARFFVFNTHWDHRSQPSREGAARLVLARIASQTAGGPVILTGDFNAGEGNPAFRALVSDGEVSLTDSFRVAHPDETAVGTFNGFEGKCDGEKIDAVLISDHWITSAAAIVRSQRDGRYPSDHFPVSAVLQLP